MKIDRHNYEEFFILYWDNELAVAQKQAVEDFVNQNADLREEFELLGETRFTPDADIHLKEKDFLLNDTFINITNYEEQLLNYIDDEVSDDEREQVEKFAQLNPAIQKELALLQKTKLQPEAVGFPDKSVLYRREEKVRVISMTWFRVAVAAAIIIIAGFTALQLVNNGTESNTPPVASVNNPKTNSAEKKTDDPQNKVEHPTNTQQQDVVNTNQKSLTTPKKEEGIKKDDNKIEQNLVADNYQPENKNNLPTPRRDLTTNDPSNTQGVLADNNNDSPILKRDRNAIQITASDTINASLPNSDVTNKPELALYIPEAEAKEKDGGGLKEFLRKTTRVFERRTKIQTTTDDNKLLVGAFAVSLK